MKEETLLTSELIKLTGASYTQINYLILSGKLHVLDRVSGRRLFSAEAVDIVLRWLKHKQSNDITKDK